MKTNTIPSVPTVWVAPEYEQGFGYEPDAAVIEAAAGLLVASATGFDLELAAARKLAAADEASKLSRPKRAELASAVQVSWPGRPGYVAQMSAATYSKRAKVGRATDDQVLTFLMACDTPSLDKLYESLPKAATGRPKGAKTAPKVAAEPEVDEDDVSEPETVIPCRWDDAHISTAAKAIVAALREQGADDVSARLVAAEAMRLLSPVRSVA
jgi:hypothetical protein